MIDGLAFGVLPEAAAASARAQSAGRAGASSAGAGNRPVARGRRGAMRAASARRSPPRAASIVTSPSTARLLVDDYDVPAGSHHRRLSRHRSRRRSRPAAATASVRLLSVGAIVPRKGFDVLIAALATLHRSAVAAHHRRRPHPRSGGRGAARCRHRAAQARRARRGAGRGAGRSASPRSTPAPTCSCWPRGSRATAWPIAEAMAHGLPVIGTTGGAIPETVPPDAGMLVEPNDVNGACRARCAC